VKNIAPVIVPYVAFDWGKFVMIDLKQHIRGVPDFPKPGIFFYDISTLLADGPAWQAAIDQLAGVIRPLKPDVLIGIESRGFLTAAPLATALDIGFVMVRKKGKLPGRTHAFSYALEYGTDTIELQEDLLKPGQRVVICDDLLATGGTATAAIQLARQTGVNVVQAAFIIELTFLGGRQKLDVPVTSLISYDK
jgi:adenine phosphoribosyltransferase